MAYDKPFRLRTLEGLTKCLENISIANGYTVDLAGKVFRGRLVFGEGDPLPLISIIEPPLPIDQIRSPQQSDASSGEWDLLVQGFLADDKTHPTDPAHVIMADVRKALANERKKRGPRNGPTIFGQSIKDKNVVEDIFIGPGVVRPADEVSMYAYFYMTITLKVVESLDLPYE